MSKNSVVSDTTTPKHVAIIMDGNGRWAKRAGKPRWVGHRAGAEAIAKVLRVAAERHIQVVSFFAFSSENWRRPQEEVQYLMKLFLHSLKTQVKELHKNNIVVRVIGDLSRFSDTIQTHIKKAEEMTKNNSGLTVVIAANYGGQWDIVQAAQQLASQARDGVILPEQIDDALFSQHLSLAGLPDPDLFIRTSGEQRISNFFLWQLAYTELYFTTIMWPDFDEEAFNQALTEYAGRHRRFGNV